MSRIVRYGKSSFNNNNNHNNNNHTDSDDYSDDDSIRSSFKRRKTTNNIPSSSLYDFDSQTQQNDNNIDNSNNVDNENDAYEFTQLDTHDNDNTVIDNNTLSTKRKKRKTYMKLSEHDKQHILDAAPFRKYSDIAKDFHPRIVTEQQVKCVVSNHKQKLKHTPSTKAVGR
jgi:hypothetical protein